MLELTIVAVIGSVLVILIIQWIMSLLVITTDNTANSAMRRDAGALVSSVNADLSGAQSCSPTGDGPVMAFTTPFSSATSAQSFGVYTTNAAGATPSDPALVIWTFNFDPANADTLLNAERTVVGPISGGCSGTEPPSGFNAATNPATQVIASGPAAPTGAAGIVVTDITGAGGVAPGYTGSCVDSPADMLNCTFTALSFDFIFRSSAGTPDIINTSLALNQSTSNI
jgi:hypothetical protein